MPDDLDKSQREVEMFYEYIARSGRSIDPSSVEKRHPPEPGILCRLNKSESVAFEFVEIGDESLGRTKSVFIRTESSVLPILNKMLNKMRDRKYDTHYPIELLVYVYAPVIDSSDQIISMINRVFFRRDNYRRVWFMDGKVDGKGEVYECVIDRVEPPNTV